VALAGPLPLNCGCSPSVEKKGSSGESVGNWLAQR
jgi:hypothetical protein